MPRKCINTNERLFGMEIEYGFSVRNRDAVRSFDWLDYFMTVARKQLPHLPSMDGGGIFLENGARLYVDSSHPEMTTPECANPWDVVRYMQAGEKILTSIAEEMKNVMIFKTNVDHSGSGASWGCHTSFMHLGNSGRFPVQIIPHLVSRIIYSGAGGMEPLADGRLGFTLSPRVRFLEQVVSDQSTNARGIFHTKDETLAAEGYHRLHIICGESLCSETALWLSMATTALVVRMIEAGLQPGQDVRLRDPLAAMRTFALDPTCRASAEAIGGKLLNAVQVQRHYLEMAEANRHEAFMPPWTNEACFQWRKMLDCLENGAPGSVASTLDWAIKLGLFLNRAEKQGVGLNSWHHAHLERHRQTSNAGGNQSEEFRLKDSLADPPPALLSRVHDELCEIDTRFGQLGGAGIFSALNRAGVLKHHMPGVDNIEHAIKNPPIVGRAALRGRCVQRFAGQNRRYACGWSGVVDREKNLILDISDPFNAEECWREVPGGFHESLGSLHHHLYRLLSEARASHDRGHHEAAAELLQQLGRFRNSFETGRHSEYLRLHAWVQSRRGYLDGVTALDEMAEGLTMDLSTVNGYVCIYRYQGLIPSPEIVIWIKRGRKLLAASDDRRSGAALPFLGHYGYWLLRNGKPKQALRVLQDACQPHRRECAHPAAVARALADQADAWRALGHPTAAAAVLDEARNLQIEHQLEGDLADFALTYRAKLAPNPDQSLQLLAEAKAIQTRLRNLPGEVRTLLLETRLLKNPRLAEPARKRLLQLRGLRPALAQCRLLARILDRDWDTWANGEPDPKGGSDYYWWL